MAMLPDEIEMMRGSVRALLESHAPDRILDELLRWGWVDVLSRDPDLGISVLAEEAGRINSPAPFLDLALSWGAGLPLAATQVIVLPRPWREDQIVIEQHTGNGEKLPFEGYGLAGFDRHETLVAPSPDGLMLVPDEAVQLSSVRGLDPAMGLMRLSGKVKPQTLKALTDRASWDRAVDIGRLAIASQLVGATSAMLQETVEYVTERRIFGQPVGALQTVKHRLADVRIALDAASGGIAMAWIAGSSSAAMAAKALAWQAHRRASEHCLQVHGGVGFTVEHGFFSRIRRGCLLDGFLGSGRQMTSTLGMELLRSGEVPRNPRIAQDAG